MARSNHKPTWAYIAVLIASLAVVQGLVGITVYATVAPLEASQANEQERPIPLLAPAHEFQQYVRSFPIQSEADPLHEAIPYGLFDPTPYDRENVDRLIGDLAAPLGLRETISTLFARILNSQLVDEYPYYFPELDPAIETNLDRDAVIQDPSAVIDFTALLIVAADAFQAITYNRLAFSTLKYSLGIVETCDLRLQLFGLLALDEASNPRDLETEYFRTRAICPSDPTAAWWLTHNAAAHAVSNSSDFITEWPSLAEMAAATLREEFPDLPHGYIGLAEMLLDQAAVAERDGRRPFETRAWRMEALSLVEQARSISDDPALLLSHARALISLERYDAADRVLSETPIGLTNNWAFLQARLRLLQGKGDFAGILTLLRSVDPPTYPDGLSLASASTDRSGFNWFQTSPTIFTLLRRPSIGGGILVSDTNAVRQSIRSYSSTGCFQDDFITAATVEYHGIDAEADDLDEWARPRRLCLGAALKEHNLNELDVLRWAEEYDSALALAIESAELSPSEPRLWEIVGEIHSLTGTYDKAHAVLEHARQLADSQTVAGSGLGRDMPIRLCLRSALAASSAGDTLTAQLTLEDCLDRSLADNHYRGFDQHIERFYVASELGRIALLQGDFAEAVEQLELAVQLGQEVGDAAGFVDHEGDPRFAHLLRGAQENNLAIALVELGDHERAIEMATAALSRDRANPIFLNTLAFAHHMAGHSAEAIQHYTSAITVDQSTYPATNNLAVLLATAGSTQYAIDLWKKALQVAPDYALAWHNLGVAQAGGNWRDLLASQASLGKAGRLDRSLRGADLTFIVDEDIRDSGLDISKPLPADWAVAANSSRLLDGFTLSMFILITVRVVWPLGLGRFVSEVANRLSKRRSGEALPSGLAHQLEVGAALISSFLILLWGGRTAVVSWNGVLLLFGVTGALVCLPTVTRSLVGDSGLSQQSGWIPGILLSFAAAPFGLTLVPFPGLEDSSQALSKRVLYGAAATTTACFVVFSILAAFTAVPAARVTAILALALLGSILLPFPPFDGHRLTNRLTGLCISAALMLATAMVALQWI